MKTFKLKPLLIASMIATLGLGLATANAQTVITANQDASNVQAIPKGVVLSARDFLDENKASTIADSLLDTEHSKSLLLTSFGDSSLNQEQLANGIAAVTGKLKQAPVLQVTDTPRSNADFHVVIGNPNVGGGYSSTSTSVVSPAVGLAVIELFNVLSEKKVNANSASAGFYVTDHDAFSKVYGNGQSANEVAEASGRFVGGSSQPIFYTNQVSKLSWLGAFLNGVGEVLRSEGNPFTMMAPAAFANQNASVLGNAIAGDVFKKGLTMAMFPKSGTLEPGFYRNMNQGFTQLQSNGGGMPVFSLFNGGSPGGSAVALLRDIVVTVIKHGGTTFLNNVGPNFNAGKEVKKKIFIGGNNDGRGLYQPEGKVIGGNDGGRGLYHPRTGRIIGGNNDGRGLYDRGMTGFGNNIESISKSYKSQFNPKTGSFTKTFTQTIQFFHNNQQIPGRFVPVNFTPFVPINIDSSQELSRGQGRVVSEDDDRPVSESQQEWVEDIKPSNNKQ